MATKNPAPPTSTNSAISVSGMGSPLAQDRTQRGIGASRFWPDRGAARGPRAFTSGATPRRLDYVRRSTVR
jgi:hypothetical protein